MSFWKESPCRIEPGRDWSEASMFTAGLGQKNELQTGSVCLSGTGPDELEEGSLRCRTLGKGPIRHPDVFRSFDRHRQRWEAKSPRGASVRFTCCQIRMSSEPRPFSECGFLVKCLVLFSIVSFDIALGTVPSTLPATQSHPLVCQSGEPAGTRLQRVRQVKPKKLDQEHVSSLLRNQNSSRRGVPHFPHETLQGPPQRLFLLLFLQRDD